MAQEKPSTFTLNISDRHQVIQLRNMNVTHTIEDVKKIYLFQEMGDLFHYHRIRLYYNAKQMHENKTLMDYKISKTNRSPIYITRVYEGII